MKDAFWTKEKKDLIAKLYTVYTIRETAELMGVSIATVKRMVQKLQIQKGRRSISKTREEFVRNNFHIMSNGEIASRLGITKTSVRRIANKLSLSRTNNDIRNFLSMKRNELVRKERSRLLFGLAPISNLKTVTNRKKIRCRYSLKKYGYIVHRNENTIYYSDKLARVEAIERRAERNGLRILPLAAEPSCIQIAI